MADQSVYSIGAGIAALIAAAIASAADVNVVGLFPGKALLEINKARAKLVSVGQSIDGIKLIAADSDKAVVEINGKRETLQLGQSIARMPKNDGARPQVVLTADSRGHFLTTGTINGATTRFLVDTGASHIAMSSGEAKRLGISYLSGPRALSQTASGVVPTYLVRLDSVKVGDISLNQVDAAVIEGDALPITLLGMSFLNRVDMKRAGTTLTLIKNY